MVNKPQMLVSLLAKVVINYFVMILGTLSGYGGVPIIVTTFLDSKIGEAFANFMTSIFPFRFFANQGYGWLYILYIIAFIISALFLIRTFRKFLVIFSEIKNWTNTSWLEHLKTNFALGFWAGICLFILIWIIIMPIFVYPSLAN